MFEPVKKIVLLCSLAAGITLFSAACAHAQKIEAEVLSSKAWIDKYGSEAIKKNQADVLLGKKVYCGSQEGEACVVGEQICLRCTYRKRTKRTMGIVGHDIKKEIGACFDKDAVAAAQRKTDGLLNLFRTKNTECPSQEDADKDWEGSGWGGMGYAFSRERLYKGVVDPVPSGFIGTKLDKKYDGVKDMMGGGYDKVKETWENFHGSDGKLYAMYAIGGTITIVMADENGGPFMGCEVLPVKIYNMSACFFCPLANVIFTAANQVTTDAFQYFGSAFKIVIVMVFCIWLALAALGQVSPMTKQDAPKFLAAILKQGFKFMLAYCLLVYSNDLFRYFVVPVLDSGLVLGTGIQTVSMPTPENYGASSPGTGANYYNLPGADGTTLYNRIEEYLASMQARLSYVQAIGTTIFCVGSHKLSFWELLSEEGRAGIKAGLRMMMLGGVLTSFSFLLTMAFAFYFMDAILQMAVIGAMIPFMIAGWPFRATAQYAGIGFKMLLNTFFAMFFTGFVISVNVELINQSLALSQDKNTGAVSEAPKKETSAELGAAQKETASGFQKITDAINNQNWSAINKATDIGGTGFLLLAFCCIFGFKFVNQVTPLASKLSAGGFSKGGIAGKIGTMAASAAKGMAAKAAAPVGRVAGNAALGAVGSVAQKAGNVAGGVVGGAAKLAGKGLSAAGGAVSGHGGLAGKALGGALKGAGAIADKAGSAANAVGRGVGNIAKGAADGMKKQ